MEVPNIFWLCFWKWWKFLQTILCSNILSKLIMWSMEQCNHQCMWDTTNLLLVSHRLNPIKTIEIRIRVYLNPEEVQVRTPLETYLKSTALQCLLKILSLPHFIHFHHLPFSGRWLSHKFRESMLLLSQRFWKYNRLSLVRLCGWLSRSLRCWFPRQWGLHHQTN